MSQRALEDIEWWKEEAIKYQRNTDLTVSINTVITDASSEGWSGHFESLSTYGGGISPKLIYTLMQKNFLMFRKV